MISLNHLATISLMFRLPNNVWMMCHIWALMCLQFNFKHDPFLKSKQCSFQCPSHAFNPFISTQSFCCSKICVLQLLKTSIVLFKAQLTVIQPTVPWSDLHYISIYDVFFSLEKFVILLHLNKITFTRCSGAEAPYIVTYWGPKMPREISTKYRLGDKPLNAQQEK